MATEAREKRYYFDRFGVCLGHVDEVGHYFDRDGLYRGSVRGPEPRGYFRILPIACFAEGAITARITGGVFQDFAPSPQWSVTAAPRLWNAQPNAS